MGPKEKPTSNSVRHPFPGSTVAKRFVVDRVLGAGGMGVVVAAHLPPESPAVAVKMLHATLLDEPIHRARFEREGRTLLRLRTEHTPRWLEMGDDDNGIPYIIMELIEGIDLRSVVRDNGPLVSDVAASYVLQVCVALGEAHALGVVHRDLKPGNLMLTQRSDGSPLIKVLDFGIASPDLHESNFGLRTEPNAFLGSYNYMSPEQIRSPREVDSRCDIWAFGAILYFLLTGQAPFVAPTPADAITRIMQEPVDLEPLWERQVPAGLCEVLLRCLQKSKEKRFAHAVDVARALAPFCSSIHRSGRYQHELRITAPILLDAPAQEPADAEPEASPPVTRRMALPVEEPPIVEGPAAEAPVEEPLAQVQSWMEAETVREGSPPELVVAMSEVAASVEVARPRPAKPSRRAPAMFFVPLVALLLGGVGGALWKGRWTPSRAEVMSTVSDFSLSTRLQAVGQGSAQQQPIVAMSSSESAREPLPVESHPPSEQTVLLVPEPAPHPVALRGPTRPRASVEPPVAQPSRTTPSASDSEPSDGRLSEIYAVYADDGPTPPTLSPTSPEPSP